MLTKSTFLLTLKASYDVLPWRFTDGDAEILNLEDYH